ncbi:MAG: hypothetical protein J6Y80_07155 [Victivallales bacterium]|nr:hypothetical protein [Victivallales bacterium]
MNESSEPELNPMLESLKELLTDPNPCISSLAMKELLDHPDKCEQMLETFQDDPDLALRHSLHQLAGCLRLRKLHDKFVFEYEQGTLEPWDAMLIIDQLYDLRSSKNYLHDMAQDFLTAYDPADGCSLRKIARHMKARNFSVPPHPILNIYHFLVGDILENGQGTAAVLCVLAQLIGNSQQLPLQIALANGKFCLVDHQRNLLDPTEDWAITPKASQDSFHTCSNQEVIRVYLAQLVASSIIVWETFDAHLFLRLLLQIDNFSRAQLPYPFGKLHAPKPDQDS